MSKSTGRVDGSGKAYKGSQYQLQTYIDLHAPIIEAAISNLLPLQDATIDWRSPLRTEQFREYRDQRFLSAFGLERLKPALQQFWPQGGPVWDGLGAVQGSQEWSYLLLEAKSHPSELFSRCTASSVCSIALIRRSLDREQERLLGRNKMDWTTSNIYQYANRLAHIAWLNQFVTAHLINVYFVKVEYSPTTLKTWTASLSLLKRNLGLRDQPPNVLDLFLPALPYKQLS